MARCWAVLLGAGLLAMVAGCAAPVATPAPAQAIHERYGIQSIRRTATAPAFHLLVGAHDIGGRLGICAALAQDGQDSTEAGLMRRALQGTTVSLAGVVMLEDLSYAAPTAYHGGALDRLRYVAQPSACRTVDRPWRPDYATADIMARVRF